MNLTLLFLLTILAHLPYAGARVTLSLYAINLGATPLTVGIVISLLAVVPMLFSVRWGRHIDRIGIYKPMLLGATLVLTALIIAAAAPRIEALYIVSAFAGSGFMLYHICVNQAAALIGRPEDRTRNFSVLALAFSTSGFIGPMSAGFAIDWIGHRYTFLLFATGLVAVLTILLRKKALLVQHHAASSHEGEKHIRDLLRIPSMKRMFIISGLLSMSWDLYTFVMPIHGTNIGLSASTIGLILGSFGCAIFVFRLVLPWVVHRLDEHKLLSGAMLLTGTMLALIPLMHSVPLLMLASFVLGLGLGGTQPMIMALLYEKAPPGRGAEAVGMRTLLLNISQAGIPLVFGALGAALGMTPVFITMGASLLAGGWYARRPEPAATEKK